jgi:hypothetical protein
MKKRAFILWVVMSALFAAAHAEVTHMQQANQVTIGWDAVPEATGYRVYTKLLDGSAETMIGETGDTRYTISFDADTIVLVGVQAVRVSTSVGMSGSLEVVSRIAWSDAPSDCMDGSTFGVYYLKLPAGSGELRSE